MSSKSRSRRSAFTLVEILVTTLVMLIMILAISQMFALVGSHVTDGRALIEVQGQLRNASFNIQEHLNGISVVARHSPDFDLHLGYFEYLEGADWDLSDTDQTIGSDRNPWWLDDTITFIPTEHRPFFNTANYGDPLNAAFTAYGDIDDVVMFTARSTGRPFVGRSPVGTIESHDAEIIYWTNWNDAVPSGDGDGEIDFGEITLHRRVLLIRPDISLAAMPTYASLTPAIMRTFHGAYDLSVHPEVTQDAMGNDVVILVPNSLTDLARRENRVAHLPNVSAGNPLGIAAITPTELPLSQNTYYPNRFTRQWLPPTDDVVIADVLAFDVRVFDPTAPLRQFLDTAGQPTGDLLRPGDVHWEVALPASTPAGATVGQGAFVDLRYPRNYSPVPSVTSWFSADPSAKSGMAITGPPARVFPTYDTWTWAYEHDGIDQDNDSDTDEATDGVDTDSANGVDDFGERETLPPYASPLRGIQITLRVVELDTRQVRQTSIVSRLMPE